MLTQMVRVRPTIIISENTGSHISGLLFNMINEFWPELLQMGVIHKLNPPLIMATQKGVVHEFTTTQDYVEWAGKHPNHKHKYYKGLGSYETKDFKRFLETPEKYMVRISIEDDSDTEHLDIAFSRSMADVRKEWLVE
ncbi:DNA topoisomerase IV subunit B [compost metagenome]